jgi:hypothetical protein
LAAWAGCQPVQARRRWMPRRQRGVEPDRHRRAAGGVSGLCTGTIRAERCPSRATRLLSRRNASVVALLRGTTGGSQECNCKGCGLRPRGGGRVRVSVFDRARSRGCTGAGSGSSELACVITRP